MKPRKPINKVSTKQKIRNTDLKVIKSEIIRDQQSICYCCETKQVLDGAHIIRRTANLEFYVDRRNLVGLCRRCHVLFDDGPLVQFLKLPNSEKILQRMKELDELYFNRYLDLSKSMTAQIIFITQYRKIAPGTLFNAEIHQFSDKLGFQAFSIQGHDGHHFHIGRVDVREIFDIIQFVNSDEAESFRLRYQDFIPHDLKICYSLPHDDVAPNEGYDEIVSDEAIIISEEEDLPL